MRGVQPASAAISVTDVPDSTCARSQSMSSEPITAEPRASRDTTRALLGADVSTMPIGRKQRRRVETASNAGSSVPLSIRRLAGRAHRTADALIDRAEVPAQISATVPAFAGNARIE